MRRIPVLLLLVLGGCNDKSANSAEVMSDFTSQRINALSSRVAALESSRATSVFMKPTDKEFAFLSTEGGVLAISIEKVEPLANGSRLTLRFGNPADMTISSMRYHVEWGPVDERGLPIAGQIKAADRTISAPLFSGSWNTVTIPLADVPPAKLGYVEISRPRFDEIALTPR